MNFHSSVQESLSDVQCEIVQSECVKSGRPYQGDFYHNRVPLFKNENPSTDIATRNRNVKIRQPVFELLCTRAETRLRTKI